GGAPAYKPATGNQQEPTMAADLLDEISRRDILRIAGGAVAALAFAASPLAAFAQAGPMKVGTIGAGREGGALGSLFAKAGHPVVCSSRPREQLGELVASAGANAKAGTVQQAVDFADIVLLVVPYSAVEQIGREHGKALAAKPLVMDVSNPIARRDGEALVKQVDEQGGAGLATAKMLPGSHIVRAFNAIGSAQLAQLANRPGEPVGVPIAGDDKNAVTLAEKLIKEIGFEPVLVGGLAMGKYLNVGAPLARVHTP